MFQRRRGYEREAATTIDTATRNELCLSARCQPGTLQRISGGAPCRTVPARYCRWRGGTFASEMTTRAGAPAAARPRERACARPSGRGRGRGGAGRIGASERAAQRNVSRTRRARSERKRSLNSQFRATPVSAAHCRVALAASLVSHRPNCGELNNPPAASDHPDPAPRRPSRLNRSPPRSR